MPRCEGMPVPEFDTRHPPLRRCTKAPKTGVRVTFAFLVGDEVYDCTAAEAAELEREAGKPDAAILVTDPTKESTQAEQLLRTDVELMELRAKCGRQENEIIELKRRNESLQSRVVEVEEQNRSLRSLASGGGRKSQDVSTTLVDPAAIPETGRTGGQQQRAGR